MNTTTNATANDVAEDGIYWFSVGANKIPQVKGWSDPKNCNNDQHKPLPATGVYGLLTGYRWNVLDLDVRPANGDRPAKDGRATLQAYLDAKGIPWPVTYTVRTPSGGLHLYFEADPARPMRKRCPTLAGVDFLARGAYARAGAGYNAFVDVDCADTPEWLYELIESKVTKVTGDAADYAPIAKDDARYVDRVTRATAYLLKTDPCVSGRGGDERLWEVCLRLTNTYELPLDTATDLIGLHFNPRCEPPWGEDVVRRKLREAAEKGAGPRGTGIVGTSPGTANGDDAPDGDKPHVYKFVPQDTMCNGELTTRSQPDLNAIFAGQAALSDWCGVFRRDIMSNVITARNPPMRLDCEKPGQDLSSDDVRMVQHWLGCEAATKTTLAMVDSAIRFAAKGRECHPIREYLAALPTATTSHLATIGLDLFGDESPRASEFIRKWLIGCVARVMPAKKGEDVKFDTVLTLSGNKGGERKSTFFEAMATVDYYRADVAKLDNPQSVGMNLRGMWIVELGELSAMKSSDREAFKAFITRTREQFNAKYERAEAREPRQCGIGATTNSETFLDIFDPAVARRFWPVRVNKRIDIAWVREHRDELWAEAYAAYKAGEAWWYEDESVLAADKKPFTETSVIEEKLADYLADPARRASLDGKNATLIAQMVLGLQGIPSTAQRNAMALALKNDLPGVIPPSSKNRKKWYYKILALDADGKPETEAAYEARHTKPTQARIAVPTPPTPTNETEPAPAEAMAQKAVAS